MTVVVWQAQPATSGVESRFLADEFWPTDETWRRETEDYLNSIKPIVFEDSSGDTSCFSDDACVAHVTNKLKRIRRRSMAERAESRRLRTAERLMSDVEHFGDRSEDWRERSRTLVLRGRSIRSVLARTWADDDSRHFMVCWGRTEDGIHQCKSLTPLVLGGPWRYWRRYDECPDKWYRTLTYRSVLRHVALDEYRRDDLQGADEAFGLQLLHPVTLLIFARLVAHLYWPRCSKCDALVGVGEESEHRYGHQRNHFGYSEWLAAKPGCYTTQSFNWPVVRSALCMSMHRWRARRDWSTHVRRITINGATTWWQPRPNMNSNDSSYKNPLGGKPGRGNYTII